MGNPPEESAPGAAEASSARAAALAFQVALPPARPGEPPFEGPLDLLLHLVKEHRVDLFDIPIARITESYLATLEVMRQMDIDVAGEFLHMAAQLLLMKSRLLLPRTEVAEDVQPEEEGADPRAELVRRLLEYQKYRAAGEELGRHDVLDRDVYARRTRAAPLPAPDGPEGLADVSVFKLIEALDRALQKARPELQHQVRNDRLSITDAISRVAEALRLRRRASFEELLVGGPGQPAGSVAIIGTFLAILEMARLRLVRLYQSAEEAGSEIVVEALETLGEGGPGAGDDAEVDYR